MKQQDIIRQAMQQSGQTRAQMAAELGVSKRALDKWLLPETSGDFRHMPETALRLLSNRFGVRRSADLSLPYDWPNPAMADDTLILAVLRRARFADLVQVCMDYGLPVVQARLPHALSIAPEAERPILSRILSRMLRSIAIAFSERSAA
jgi:transcriptional regulator with XRE-family HTH domain